MIRKNKIQYKKIIKSFKNSYNVVPIHGVNNIKPLNITKIKFICNTLNEFKRCVTGTNIIGNNINIIHFRKYCMLNKENTKIKCVDNKNRVLVKTNYEIYQESNILGIIYLFLLFKYSREISKILVAFMVLVAIIEIINTITKIIKKYKNRNK